METIKILNTNEDSEKKKNLKNKINIFLDNICKIVPLFILLINIIILYNLSIKYKEVDKIIKDNSKNTEKLPIMKYKDQILNDKNINELLKMKDEIMKIKLIIEENSLLKSYNGIKKENIMNHSYIDKDMIGLKYPEIMFDKIKLNLIDNKIISSLYEFMEQLEIKLIYLEKEINVTKINAFYTARKLYLDKKKINYDDWKINELHNIISWLVIHKSTQLKGIASDKYLACKYVLMKLGINLCSHRIGVYNNIEEIDFEQLIKMNNVVLKISNGCKDNIFIRNNTKNDIEKIKKRLLYSFNRDYGLVIPEFFHLYSKKRIILEKIFSPISDLYEFKLIIINCKITMICIRVYYNKKLYLLYYDPNFNLINKKKPDFFNINEFKTELLNNIKYYALKLSEDFKNFVRIDLYLFHEKIYLSELTFDADEGAPRFKDFNNIKEASKKWNRIY